MTGLGTCRIRRGAGKSLAVPPSRVITEAIILGSPTGRAVTKVTERTLQALLNGNSNPKGRAGFPSQAAAPPALQRESQAANDRSGEPAASGLYSRELIFDVISRILSCRQLEEFGSSCSTFSGHRGRWYGSAEFLGDIGKRQVRQLADGVHSDLAGLGRALVLQGAAQGALVDGVEAAGPR